MEGISEIMLLDLADFDGFKFDSDNLYENCRVTAILRSGDLVNTDASESAKYNSTLQNGMYTHTLETFIAELSATMESLLHLSSKRRYVVVFKSNAGRYFTFGYNTGATISYANQTNESTGSVVTMTASSIYPLFEVAESAFTALPYNMEFIPDFVNRTYCDFDKTDLIPDFNNGAYCETT